jgi:hypothetical protein
MLSLIHLISCLIALPATLHLSLKVLRASMHLPVPPALLQAPVSPTFIRSYSYSMSCMHASPSPEAPPRAKQQGADLKAAHTSLADLAQGLATAARAGLELVGGQAL